MMAGDVLVWQNYLIDGPGHGPVASNVVIARILREPQPTCFEPF
jgi:hypothetical protein